MLIGKHRQDTGAGRKNQSTLCFVGMMACKLTSEKQIETLNDKHGVGVGEQ